MPRRDFLFGINGINQTTNNGETKMKKKNLKLVAEGYDPHYSNFQYGNHYINVSLVFKVFWDDEYKKFRFWYMPSNGIYGTGYRRWSNELPCALSGASYVEYLTDDEGIIQLLEKEIF